MDETGFKVTIDKIGRVTIPKKWRQDMGLTLGSIAEVQKQGDIVIIRKAEPHCVFCGKLTQDTLLNKSVCKECQEKIKNKT